MRDGSGKVLAINADDEIGHISKKLRQKIENQNHNELGSIAASECAFYPLPVRPSSSGGTEIGKVRRLCCTDDRGLLWRLMVETAGIEPASEIATEGPATGLVGV